MKLENKKGHVASLHIRVLGRKICFADLAAAAVARAHGVTVHRTTPEAVRMTCWLNASESPSPSFCSWLLSPRGRCQAQRNMPCSAVPVIGSFLRCPTTAITMPEVPAFPPKSYHLWPSPGDAARYECTVIAQSFPFFASKPGKSSL